MPKNARLLIGPQESIGKKSGSIDINGLYEVVDEIIKKAHTTLEIGENTKLGNLKKRLGYFAHIDIQLSLLRDALAAWKKYRDSSSLSFPLSLEDELTLVFYIFLYHDASVKKIETLRALLSELGILDIPNSLLRLCEEQVLEKKPLPEKGLFEKNLASL